MNSSLRVFVGFCIFTVFSPHSGSQQCPGPAPVTELGARVHLARYFKPAERYIRIAQENSRYLQARIEVDEPSTCAWRLTVRDEHERPIQVLTAADFPPSIKSRWAARVFGSVAYLEMAGCQPDSYPKVSVREYIAMPAKAKNPYYSSQIDGKPKFIDLYSEAVPSEIKQLGDQVSLLTISWGRDTWSCSGVLLTANSLLTNWHCGGLPTMPEQGFWNDQIIKDTSVDFSWDGDVFSWDYAAIRLLASSKELDYALLEVAPRGGFGVPPPPVISTEPVVRNQEIRLLHHPATDKKQVTMNCSVDEDKYSGWKNRAEQTEFTHRCDTETGSSGAPIFDSKGRLVGLHHLGFDVDQNCQKKDRINKAIHISKIIEHLRKQPNPDVKTIISKLFPKPAVTPGSSTPSVTGFSVHTDTAKNTTAALSTPECTGSQRTNCKPTGRDIGESIVEVEISSTAFSSITDARAAWDEAYRLRGVFGVDRVEPNFEYWDDSSRQFGASCPSGDPSWARRHIRLLGAWGHLQTLGVKDGSEGADVLIAHIDTGYTKNPEIYDPNEPLSTVLYKQGYNYVENGSDPVDPLSSFALLANPGHGTKSSSVIASRKGKQGTFGRPDEFVEGVAPGAKLIPLRVHKSVVHILPFALTRGILDAVRDRTKIKQKPHIISIAMGGLPSWGMWKAVRAAEKEGIIVVAAAGNQVGFVVWPARFSQVISATASNESCGIWDGASKGKVDITAPGEVIKHTFTQPNEDFGYATSCGTTYATAHTTGVAALWLQRHDHLNSPIMKSLRERGHLGRAFRAAIQTTAWVPASPPPGITCRSTSWNPARTGPGLLDAEGTLKYELALVQLKASLTQPETSLPLFQTLFPATTPSSEIERSYAALLRISTQKISDFDHLEAEILYHYGTNSSVQGAIDHFVIEKSSSRATIARDALRAVASVTLRTALSQGDASGVNGIKIE